MSSLPGGGSLCYSSAPFLPKAHLFAMSPENQSAAYPAHRFSIAPMLDGMH
jgi:tRNA-dihydrouridine synthase A